MKNLTGIAFVLALIFLTACNTMEKSDLIIKNAKIYTVNAQFEMAEAMAIKDGKIQAIGGNDEILGKYDAGHIYDMDGKPVYPGFIDAHCHFLGYGTGLLKRADLTGTQSFDEVLERVQAHAEKFPSIAWLEGRGWDQNDWPEKEFPNKERLDQLFPDKPVMLTRIDGHAALVNSKALQLADITVTTKIEGGEVQSKSGVPSGILIDNAMELVYDKIPAPDNQQIAEALLAAQKECFAVGLTSVHDAGLETNEIAVVDSMQKQESLQMRIYAMLSPTAENFKTYVEKGTYKTDRLNVRSIKLYADGALGSRGAKMLADYSDDAGNSGLILRSPDSIRDICKTAYEKGFQINTHAIGDSANRMMLQLYGESLKGKNDRRWRIEHAQIVAPEDFELFGKYSIVPSVQPTHATSDMYWAEDRVGPQRIKGAYAYKNLLAQNGWIPLGTDFPIENINPIYTFYAAVARKDLKGWPPEGFQMENALSREESLKGMTIWAAKAAFEENEKGSLEVGKMADFVVLSDDIMQIPLGDIPQVQVLKTFSGGAVVFGR